MNKDQLQQELLKKVKPGIKPSDLKKQREENSQLLTPPPTPPLKPSKKDIFIPPLVSEPKPATERDESPVKTKKTPLIPKPEPQQYLFTCDICQQNKKSQLHLSRVNGLGIDPHKQNKICAYCIKKVDLIQERKEEFF